MKQCLYCQKEFESTKSFAKFCSSNCRVYYNKYGRPKKGLEPIPIVDEPIDINKDDLPITNVDAQTKTKNTKPAKKEPTKKEDDSVPWAKRNPFAKCEQIVMNESYYRQRLKDIEGELATPPKQTSIPFWMWLKVRKDMIVQINEILKNKTYVK